LVAGGAGVSVVGEIAVGTAGDSVFGFDCNFSGTLEAGVAFSTLLGVAGFHRFATELVAPEAGESEAEEIADTAIGSVFGFGCHFL
jgi:hypothetical protein